MSIRRFIPDFKILTGDAQITINLRKFPADTAGSSPLGPFTISSSAEKVDTEQIKICKYKGCEYFN